MGAAWGVAVGGATVGAGDGAGAVAVALGVAVGGGGAGRLQAAAASRPMTSGRARERITGGLSFLTDHSFRKCRLRSLPEQNPVQRQIYTLAIWQCSTCLYAIAVVFVNERQVAVVSVSKAGVEGGSPSISTSVMQNVRGIILSGKIPDVITPFGISTLSWTTFVHCVALSGGL